jgi:CheY-like chemotaxis protein
MKILIAEDCLDTALLYESLLKERNHKVTVTNDGEDCLKRYHEEYQKLRNLTDVTEHTQPFDVVLLDYKMPKIDGMEVAKEILAVNPHQRIVFASAYVKETLIHSINHLKQLVELPFIPSRRRTSAIFMSSLQYLRFSLVNSKIYLIFTPFLLALYTAFL